MLRRLGASCDWSRERFTLDPDLQVAVRKVFVQLHKEGLIYRDKRLVNWDPKLLTAVSDIEVQQVDVRGHLWHFRYPVVDETGQPTRESIVVATTRPETMLGDTGVAVHPEDERYAALVGKRVRLPLVGRLIPIVADSYSDPEKGTGAVKITPAHDFNDFEVGRRHALESIPVLDEAGRVNANAPEAYRGLDRFDARRRVVAEFEAMGLLEKVEKYRHTVPHGDRSSTPQTRSEMPTSSCSPERSLCPRSCCGPRCTCRSSTPAAFPSRRSPRASNRRPSRRCDVWAGIPSWPCHTGSERRRSGRTPDRADCG